VTPERLAQEVSVIGEHLSIALAKLALEPGRSFDVG